MRRSLLLPLCFGVAALATSACGNPSVSAQSSAATVVSGGDTAIVGAGAIGGIIPIGFYNWADIWDNWGGAASDPAITESADGSRIDVFFTGIDGQLVHGWRVSGGAMQYEALGTLDGPMKSGPAAVAWGNNNSIIDVVVRGAHDDIVHRRYNGSWEPWESLGGVTYDRPAITKTNVSTSWGPIPRVYAFARGTDNHLYFNSNSLGWNGWTKVDDFELFSAPGATSWGDDRIDVFAKGYNDALFHKYGNGLAWYPSGGWEQLGGVLLDGAPAAASKSSNTLDVFVQGTNRGLYQISWTGSQWTGFSQIAPCMWHQPADRFQGQNPSNLNFADVWAGSAAAAVGANGGEELVLWGADGNLWHDHWGLYFPSSTRVTPPACPCGGAPGQECCVGMLLGDTCGSSDVVCSMQPNQAPVCAHCGGLGEVCCSQGYSCPGPGLTCNDQNACASCGHVNESPCPGDPPTCVDSSLKLANGRCLPRYPCGHAWQPSCDDGSCPGGDGANAPPGRNLMNDHDLCVPCGFKNNRCCPGNDEDAQCPGWDGDADSDTLSCDAQHFCQAAQPSSSGNGCVGVKSDMTCYGVVEVCKDTYACPGGKTKTHTYPCGACFLVHW